MVERARLESEYTGNRIGGSNPPLSAINSIKKGYVSGFLILPTLKPTFKSLLRYKVFSQGGRGFPLPRELSLTPPPTQILFGTPAVGLYLVICLFCRRFLKASKLVMKFQLVIY